MILSACRTVRSIISEAQIGTERLINSMKHENVDQCLTWLAELICSSLDANLDTCNDFKPYSYREIDLNTNTYQI